MIYEMVVDTVKPGQMSRYVQGFTNTAQPLRSDHHGELLGAWTSDFGAVNQAVLLWGYESLSHYSATIDELGRNTQWAAYQADISRALILARTVELLGEGKPVRRGPITEKLHELRTYTLQPGSSLEFVAHMIAIMPVRERYHRNFAVWWPYSGDTNRTLHLWLYDDFDHRAYVREQCAKDPDWKRYLERTVPLTQSMYSTLLTPLTFGR